MLGRDLKFFDGLLTLPDRFLATEVNLWVSKGMKLASEEMLLKAGEMYANLSIRYHDIMATIIMLEEQKALVEAEYEACLRENDMLCAQLALKS